ncbi:MAG: hypothetical protein ACKVT0_14215, partial [Planctomycetaceae bacterium]
MLEESSWVEISPADDISDHPRTLEDSRALTSMSSRCLAESSEVTTLQQLFRDDAKSHRRCCHYATMSQVAVPIVLSITTGASSCHNSLLTDEYSIS